MDYLISPDQGNRFRVPGTDGPSQPGRGVAGSRARADDADDAGDALWHCQLSLQPRQYRNYIQGGVVPDVPDVRPPSESFLCLSLTWTL